MAARIKKSAINLLVKKESAKDFTEQLLAWAITYGRYIIILTQITVLFVFFARFKLDRDYTDLKESITQKQVLIESIKDIEGEIRQIQKKLSNVDGVLENQDYHLNVLRFFQNKAPSDISLSILSINKDRLSFSGSVKDLRSFNFLLSQLEQDPLFSEVTLEDILRGKEGKIEFKIQTTIVLKKPTLQKGT